MSYDKLKKLSSGGYSYKNPYAEGAKKEEPKVVAKKSLEEIQADKDQTALQFAGKIGVLERQISDLRFDIVSILMLMEGTAGEEEKYSMGFLRQKYYNWRGSELHAMNMIADKVEAVKNNDIKI